MLEQEIIDAVLDLLIRGAYGIEEGERQQVAAVLKGEATSSVAVLDCECVLVVALGPLGTGVSTPRVVRVSKFDSGLASETSRKLSREGFEGSCATTAQVAGWFRSRAAALGDEGDSFPESWAPASMRTMAHMAIAGDLGNKVAETPDHHLDVEWGYEWYDLAEVPVGGSIWRLSCQDTLWVFTRKGEDQWRVTCVPGARWPDTPQGNLGGVFAGAFLAASVYDRLLKTAIEVATGWMERAKKGSTTTA